MPQPEMTVLLQFDPTQTANHLRTGIELEPEPPESVLLHLHAIVEEPDCARLKQ